MLMFSSRSDSPLEFVGDNGTFFPMMLLLLRLFLGGLPLISKAMWGGECCPCSSSVMSAISINLRCVFGPNTKIKIKICAFSFNFVAGKSIFSEDFVCQMFRQPLRKQYHAPTTPKLIAIPPNRNYFFVQNLKVSLSSIWKQ